MTWPPLPKFLAGRRGRPAWSILAFAVPLTYGVGLWMAALHHASSDGHRRGAASLALDWLRQSTLALPAIAIAACVALALVARFGQARRLSERCERAAGATAIALATSVAVAAAAGLDQALFSPYERVDLPLPLHLLRDGLLALAAALPIAALAATAPVVRARPTRRWAGRLALSGAA